MTTMKRSPLTRKTPLRRGKKKITESSAVKAIRSDSQPRPLAQQTRVVTSVLRATSPPIEKPARMVSRTWLDMVKADPCEWPSCARKADDPHHVKVCGARHDVFDITAIPLCREHHDRAHAAKTRAEFDELHRMLGADLCRKLTQVGRETMRYVIMEMTGTLTKYEQMGIPCRNGSTKDCS